MIVRRTDDGWRLGADPMEPWRLGVFEGAGATLWWPADGGEPGGLVWDAPRAAGWLDAVWPGASDALEAAGAFRGDAIADPDSDLDAANANADRGESVPTVDDPDARRGGAAGDGTADTGLVTDGVAGDDAASFEMSPGPLAALAEQAALSGWRAAWWPASRIAGVPPLDPRLVAAEQALALAALDGVLDDGADGDPFGEASLDDDMPGDVGGTAAGQGRVPAGTDGSVGWTPRDAMPGQAERALRELILAVARLGALPEGPLRESVAALADDYGFPPRLLDAPAPLRRKDHALAAAGERIDAALLEGSSPVDPTALPQGVADPAGSIAWRIALSGGGAKLSITAPAAPEYDASRDEPRENAWASGIDRSDRRSAFGTARGLDETRGAPSGSDGGPGPGPGPGDGSGRPTGAPVEEIPAGGAGLRAVIADTEVVLTRRGVEWVGEATVPATFLALPPGRRSVRLVVPGYDAGEAAPVDVDALVAIARARLARPRSSSELDAAGPAPSTPDPSGPAR